MMLFMLDCLLVTSYGMKCGFLVCVCVCVSLYGKGHNFYMLSIPDRCMSSYHYNFLKSEQILTVRVMN